MLESQALGTAIGVVLMFATISLLCSGITETVSNWLQLRAKYLLTGLRSMLDAPESSALNDKDKAQRTALDERVKTSSETERAVMAVQGEDFATAKPAADVMTVALFNSPLLQSLQSRRIGVFKSGALRNPQYISGRTFARALVDLLVPPTVGRVPATADGPAPIQLDLNQVITAIRGLPDHLPLKAQLIAFASRAGGDLDAFETSLEHWYDDQMAKMSGWYKRWSRVVLGVAGFAVAVLANVDTLQVAHTLYVDAPVQQAVIATANAGTLCQGDASVTARNDCAKSEINQLKVAGVPIGYSSRCDVLSDHWARCWSWATTDPLHWWDFPLKLLGWLVTGFAVSFGAPFWFESLSRLGSLRNTGTKPASTTS